VIPALRIASQIGWSGPRLAQLDCASHVAGSRKLEAGWPLHAVSVWLGHANVTTTARYLNVKDDYLQELTERKPLTLVKS